MKKMQMVKKKGTKIINRQKDIEQAAKKDKRTKKTKGQKDKLTN